MEKRPDHPGVYIPPPLLYVITFFLAVLLQRLLPINPHFFHTTAAKIIGGLLIVAALFFNVPALLQFFKTKNTLITVKPAHSLQRSGIYSVSRNPMYVSLLFVYSGLSFLLGNWWNIILIPGLILWIQTYVIRREEKYLERKFGDSYLEYKSSVRRWL